MSGKAPRDPTSPTATAGSVEYNILTGKLNGTRSTENVDSLGNTMLGTEVRERFSSMRTAFLKMDSNKDGRVSANEIRNMCRQWNIPMSEAERVISAADVDDNGTLDFNEFAQRFDPAVGDDFGPEQTAVPRSTSNPYDERPVGKASRPGGGGGGGGGGGAKDATSASGSTDYDIITGRARGASSSQNEDSLGQTLLGMEVQERFASMRDAFLSLDTNQDGRVSTDELRSMCRKWHVPMGEAERVIRNSDVDADGTMDFEEFAKRFNPSAAAGGGGQMPPPESYDDRSVKAATRIQATARGRQGRAEVTARKQGKTVRGRDLAQAQGGGGGGGGGGPTSPTGRGDPSTPAGSGSRAVMFQRGGGSAMDELAQECAALKDRVGELESELAASRAREQALADRLAQYEGGGGGGGGGRGAGAAAERTAKPAADIAIYGRANCKKTRAVQQELAKAGVAFDLFDFDQDDGYREALTASGFPPNGKVEPPVVCHRNLEAWWDEPDAAIAVHFPSMVKMQVAKLGLVPGARGQEERTLERDVSIDVEIAERFRSMQDAFLKVDANRDGRVSKDELRRMCKQWNIPMTEAERVLDEADFDDNGCLDFREFARRFGR